MPTQEQTEILPPESAGTIQSADELLDGDRVVYPKQGVCRVIGRQAKEISGMKLEFIALTREEDSASILVPVGKVPTIGLRKVADTTELADVFDLLASSFDDPELDWKVRHRMHGDLLSAGGILGVAEVLKALQGLSNLRPLPQKERERYDAARHLLVNEIAVALGVPHATAEDYIDFALVPPPGVVRPASKPRRLATLPPKPARLAARRAPAEEEEEEFGAIGLEDELDLGAEEIPPDEEEAEEPEAEEEAEAEAEEAPAKKPRAAAKPKAKAKPKAAAAAGAPGEAGAKAPAKARAKAKPAAGAAAAKKPTAKKAAATGTAAKSARKPDEGAAEEKPKRATAASKKKPATDDDAASPPPARAPRAKKPE